MITVEHLIHKYKNHTVFNGVSFSQNKGTVTAIIGPSGSGKPTLIETLNALTIPNAGTTHSGNQNTVADKQSKKDISQSRKKTAMVFQNYNLFKNKTIRENITAGLLHGKKMPAKQANEMAISYLERFNLLNQKDKYPSQLSGGQSQRIGI